MKRMYVIMRERISGDDVQPVDVVSSMSKAEDVCYENEIADINHIYYWREVISSEE